MRQEFFWNEMLAPEEVDRLKSPKVFTKFKKIIKNGEKSNFSIGDNVNLLLKGNNYFVLKSLKEKYFNKVDHIYRSLHSILVMILSTIMIYLIIRLVNIYKKQIRSSSPIT